MADSNLTPLIHQLGVVTVYLTPPKNDPAAAADRARTELDGPETKDTWLINEAFEAPLQSPKGR
jgi:hypothetical protein